jgi:hypothetical protein
MKSRGQALQEITGSGLTFDMDNWGQALHLTCAKHGFILRPPNISGRWRWQGLYGLSLQVRYIM